MDIFSLAVGFVVGGLTGATGTYFGNKYTDIRRANEEIKQSKIDWKDLCNRFPTILNEMREDVSKIENKDIRRFFVCKSTSTISKSEPSFEYYTDVHSNLNAVISYLEELGYIENITTGHCPIYRFREKFIDKLRN